MDDFLWALFHYRMEPGGRALLLQALHWLAEAVEASSRWAGASDDPLQLPMPKGRQRLRPIAPAIKQGVTREASKGHLGRSGHAVAKCLQRFMRHGFFAKGANRWLDQCLAIKLQAQRKFMAGCAPVVVGLSMDATRLSGFDELWVAMSLVREGFAAWAPPQVSPSDCPVWPVGGRRPRRSERSAGNGPREHLTRGAGPVTKALAQTVWANCPMHPTFSAARGAVTKPRAHFVTRKIPRDKSARRPPGARGTLRDSRARVERLPL